VDTLQKRGTVYEKGSNWDRYIVKDGNLMTGQNPGVEELLARVVIDALG
jgi:putative intracellular protease/amidase